MAKVMGKWLYFSFSCDRIESVPWENEAKL